MIRRRILLGVLSAVLFGVGWGVGRGRAGGELYQNLDTFVEVLHAVQTSYVDPVEPRPLIQGGLRGMLQALDPYSRYLTQNEYEAVRGTLDEQFDGVGLLVDSHAGTPLVVSPIEGSPAWEAGVMPGDLIAKVDGHSTFGHSLSDVAGWLRGEPGTRVTLTVLRTGDMDERDLVIARRHVETPSVTAAFLTEPGIGYVRIASFGEHAGQELGRALDTLRAGGARAVVLDLRGNPGGLVEQAVAVVEPFVRQGSLVVSTRGRAVTEHKYLSARVGAAVTWPAAVLIDGGTASAAEIVAGSLQDLDRALVVGTASFGKGTVQDLMPLRNREGAIKLTTAWYYTASGRSLQHPVAAAVAADDDEEDAPGDSATADTSKVRHSFRTASGRPVHAGGVEPDLVVAADSLPPLAAALEQARAAFRFAPTWVGSHGASVDSSALRAYRQAAEAQGVSITEATWIRDRDAIAHGLRRELARRASGGAAAARIELADDRMYHKAVDVLRQAKTPAQVFALAAGRPAPPAAPRAHAPLRKAR